jgi:hypothetical protein
MRRAKIAPVLAQTIRNSLGPTGDSYEERGWRAMDREFRALVAVAKAAEDHSHADVEYDPVSETHLCAICRALARLRRASHPGEER